MRNVFLSWSAITEVSSWITGYFFFHIVLNISKGIHLPSQSPHLHPYDPVLLFFVFQKTLELLHRNNRVRPISNPGEADPIVRSNWESWSLNPKAKSVQKLRIMWYNVERYPSAADRYQMAAECVVEMQSGQLSGEKYWSCSLYEARTKSLIWDQLRLLGWYTVIFCNLEFAKSLDYDKITLAKIHLF